MTHTDLPLNRTGTTSPPAGGPRPVGVAVAELRRAWAAALDGQFRDPAAGVTPVEVWTPAAAERVVSVVGCAGSCGASTVSLALATAAGCPARVIECCPPAASGLAAATTAELGADLSGWLQGTRGDQVLIQRAGLTMKGPEHVPLPAPAGRMQLSVLDVGWPPATVIAAAGWLAEQLQRSASVVVVTVATVPGLRRLESVLPLLGPAVAAAAVVGPALRRWPPALVASRGSGVRRLEAAGRLVVVPRDRRLALHGLDPTPLPSPLVDAGRLLLTAVAPMRAPAGRL